MFCLLLCNFHIPPLIFAYFLLIITKGLFLSSGTARIGSAQSLHGAVCFWHFWGLIIKWHKSMYLMQYSKYSVFNSQSKSHTTPSKTRHIFILFFFFYKEEHLACILRKIFNLCSFFQWPFWILYLSIIRLQCLTPHFGKWSTDEINGVSKVVWYGIVCTFGNGNDW